MNSHITVAFAQTYSRFSVETQNSSEALNGIRPQGTLHACIPQLILSTTQLMYVYIQSFLRCPV